MSARSARPSVAFVPQAPSSNAAARTFSELPAKHLGRRGMTTRVYPPASPRVRSLLRSRHRLLHPLLAVTYWFAVVLPRRLLQLPSILRCDVIQLQSSMLRSKDPPLLEWLLFTLARRLGRAVIYHLDDALYTQVPARFIAYRCRGATLMLTGNAEIADFGRRSGARVGILEGWVRAERYPRKGHGPASPVRIGWVGTFPERNLPPIAPALAEVCARHDAIVKVVGPHDNRLSAAAPELDAFLEWETWSPEREFALFGDLDIGIMPLEDTPYNRGKEAFKLKEYLAAGLPVVASPVGHNRRVVSDGVNGYLAATHEEWVERLGRLVDDAELRARLGAAGPALVAERWNAERQIERLGELIEGLAAER
jgi:glycosyltransferase involved in cell wall biosynthesis